MTSTLQPAASRQSPAGSPTPDTAADAIAPLLASLFKQGVPVRFVLWDGSEVGPEQSPGRAIVRSRAALRRLLWAPGELGIARAFVAGELDVEGDVYGVLRALLEAMAGQLPRPADTVLPLLSAVRSLQLISLPPRPPAVEVRLSRRWRGASIHSKERDAEAVRHHYDVGNDFYACVLGPAMTYSCARFESPDVSLEEAQAAKHELVSRKLGLDGHPGARLLDVGCGWGSMAIHAASRHGAQVVGVTLSPAQAELARQRVADAGLEDQVEIRIQDYRDLKGETFDAISSIGMFEHVGEAKMGEYFSSLYELLAPRGRLLNHAISSVGGSKLRGRSFMNRYVFPDGELIDVAGVVGAMEQAGFEVRDVESLREHYALTLRHWVENLDSHWDEAVAAAGAERARVWRLYMCASVNGFEDGGTSIHQVLGVKREPGGISGMPATRSGWS
ncbi:MAG: class I SAM-dependent methyltransferase [Acidimicrobiales bacterium]